MKNQQKMAFVTMPNSPLENIVVEKGKNYDEMLTFVKQMHQHCIDNDATSLLDYQDWVLCQYFLLQKAVLELQEELK